MSNSNLFVCGTAYQLLNAISIATSQEKEKNDLLITDQEMRHICDIEEIKRTSFFSHVYVWDDISEKITHRKATTRLRTTLNNIHKLFLYPHISKIEHSLPNRENEYKKVYIGNADFPAMCVYDYFKKSGSELILYEEGTYTYNCFAVPISLKRKIASNFLFGYFVLDECREVWCRNAKMIKLGSRNIAIKQISNDFEKIREKLTNIYKSDEFDMSCLNKKIIMFDQIERDSEFAMKQSEIAKEIDSLYHDEFVVKLHPSVSNTKYDKKINIIRSGIPFEVLAAMYPMNDKILVSMCSSACFSPKSIYDMEPVLFFAFNCVNWYTLENEKYVNSIQAIYRNKNIIFVPETQEELISEICKIMAHDMAE